VELEHPGVGGGVDRLLKGPEADRLRSLGRLPVAGDRCLERAATGFETRAACLTRVVWLSVDYGTCQVKHYAHYLQLARPSHPTRRPRLPLLSEESVRRSVMTTIVVCEACRRVRTDAPPSGRSRSSGAASIAAVPGECFVAIALAPVAAASVILFAESARAGTSVRLEFVWEQAELRPRGCTCRATTGGLRDHRPGPAERPGSSALGGVAVGCRDSLGASLASPER
jgi:hypothetical protein